MTKGLVLRLWVPGFGDRVDYEIVDDYLKVDTEDYEHNLVAYIAVIDLSEKNLKILNGLADKIKEEVGKS